VCIFICNNSLSRISLFEKDGVTAWRRPGSIITVRGDGLVPYPMPQVFGLLSSETRGSEVNAQLDYSKDLLKYSNNTTWKYQKYKQVSL